MRFSPRCAVVPVPALCHGVGGRIGHLVEHRETHPHYSLSSVFPAAGLVCRMKTPWRDGTTHVIMSNGELVEKQAALVPRSAFSI